jgi:hypothetical protein
MAERVFFCDGVAAIIHEKNDNWYITVPIMKNVSSQTFRTCGNGIVRKPCVRLNVCSDAKTFGSREDARKFLMEDVRKVYMNGNKKLEAQRRFAGSL